MTETTPGKVYKIIISVVDLDNMGADDIKHLIENARYINPSVISMEVKDIDWCDEHPLNRRDLFEETFKQIFSD